MLVQLLINKSVDLGVTDFFKFKSSVLPDDFKTIYKY